MTNKDKTTWYLDPQISEDSFFIAELDICQLRLMNNAYFPWLILIPRIVAAEEITDLSQNDYINVQNEILFTAKMVQHLFSPDKMNIATLGNIVRQLHYHIIARRYDDPDFPAPVWGKSRKPYAPEEAKQITIQIQEWLWQNTTLL